MAMPSFTSDTNRLLALSGSMENLLVSNNSRAMQTLQAKLSPGYYFRAASLIIDALKNNPHCCTILIATGFPVGEFYETDGPVGAISLYAALKKLGATPIILCPASMYQEINADYDSEPFPVNITLETQMSFAQNLMDQYQPEILIAIEAAGMAKDGDYYNMHGEVISEYVPGFDQLFKYTEAPTIGIGDGGNEIGMGKLHNAIQEELSIIPSNTSCDELLLADVSNWGGHALAVLLGSFVNKDLLADFDNDKALNYFVNKGSMDGITGRAEPSEDGLSAENGQKMIMQLRHICGFSR